MLDCISLCSRSGWPPLRWLPSLLRGLVDYVSVPVPSLECPVDCSSELDHASWAERRFSLVYVKLNMPDGGLAYLRLM